MGFFRRNKIDSWMIAGLAIAVIFIALIGLVSQGTFNYIAQKKSFNRTVALNLSREGIEVVRNIRDSNWLKSCPDPELESCVLWNSSLADEVNYKAMPFFSPYDNKWILKFITASFDECVSTNACRLSLNSKGVYSHFTSAAKFSDFYRLVEINPICAEESSCGDGICDTNESCPGEQIGVQVLSHVKWEEGNKFVDITMEERLYNWR